ncbi:hypothetical protein BDB00DRAFT_773009, partial [Zychaea mexicana]|uniref:uncharacterized protein n=1 Tax=Zychaea mexicana TaxID=64656 RepID=UPI0022FECA11
FQALHQSLSYRHTLHHIAPELFPDNSCIFCPPAADTLFHLLFSCPLEWLVWICVWQDLFLFTPTPVQIHRAIFSLYFPSNPSPTSSRLIIACILQGVWCAHWRHVFDSMPFVPDNICTSIHRLLHKLIQGLRLNPDPP